MKRWLIVIGIFAVVPGGALLLVHEIRRAKKSSDETLEIEEEELEHAADYARAVGC